MIDLFKEIIAPYSCYVELRYHRREANTIVAQKGRVDVASHTRVAGVGVRVYLDGAWGFTSTSDTDRSSLTQAIDEAIKNARIILKRSKQSRASLSTARLARGEFIDSDFLKLREIPMAEKVGRVVKFEDQLRRDSSKITTAACTYKEIFEDKVIVTSDGAAAHLQSALPEIRFSAVAEHKGSKSSAMRGAGVSGDWNCLFQHHALQDALHQTPKLAVDLLSAKYPEAGLKTCILDPALVGLLSHEAIGHTVEADFVKAGSIAKDQIGKQVASKLVTMIDSGQSDLEGHAAGTIPFDDEGVLCQPTTIIENGALRSYLHNRETAAEFGAAATGHARAWMYDDEPLIRMRNTYIRPGTSKLSDMIAEIEDGYLLEGGANGQADSNGEFMFGCSNAWKIKKGKKAELLREATVSGLAFDVLKSVDAVSQEFRWDLGTGYCGKGQPAKVDAGGPYLRCKIHVGGRE